MMQNSGIICAAGMLSHILSAVMPRFKRGIQYSRGVEINH